MLLAVACSDAPADSGAGSSAPSGTPTPTPSPDPTKPGEPGTPAPGRGGDTAAPTLVKVSPAAAEQGVLSDRTIVFAFSEPMDAAKTQAAYTSAALPPDKVAFSWNAAGDVLTITPKAPLAYAVGDALVAPLAYEARIGGGATDRAGNALVVEAVASFTTLRRITFLAPRVASLSGSVTSSGSSTVSELWVGDGAANVRYKGLLTFSLEGMPAAVAEVEKATVRANQVVLTGTPDTDLGALRVQHVIYDALDLSAFNAEPIAGGAVTYGLGILATPASRWSTVTTELVDDHANRAARLDRTQYRFEYVTASDGDGVSDRFQLDIASAKLEIVYLAP